MLPSRSGVGRSSSRLYTHSCSTISSAKLPVEEEEVVVVVVVVAMVVVGAEGSSGWGGGEEASQMGGPVVEVVVVVVGVVDWGEGVPERSFLSVPGKLLFAAK